MSSRKRLPAHPLPQLAPFTCFGLEDLRPAVPVARVAKPTPAAMPALSLKTIRVGACYEFDVRGSASGQGAAYVPAVVLRKVQVRAAAPAAAGASKAGGGDQAAGARRSRSLSDVLERLQQRQGDPQQQAQGQQQPAPREAGASIKLLLWWPGARWLGPCLFA